MRVGVYVFGLASIAAGILDLIWREFDPGHQPLQAWGDHIPGVTVFACIAALWLIAGGAAILWRRTEHFGAATLAILYSIFALFPLPRFYTAPHYVGYNAAVYIGVMSSVCQQIILCVAAAIVWKSLAARGALSPRTDLLARWIVGFCSLDFGLTHLTGIRFANPFVPKWLPLGATSWTVLTGIAFMLAGLAIISGVLDVLAARLLGLMLLVFSVLVLTTPIFASPHDHAAWGANAYNLTAVGAAWIVADWLASRRQSVENEQGATPAQA
ncbi:MAG TPA: hypothetical protein VGY94_03370 [Acidobacteriaceae bacterium]|nr:hypothetical protein [Acidobacteriaceae bacterium]